MFQTVRVLFVCLLIGTMGWAASLRGTITDPSGASCPARSFNCADPAANGATEPRASTLSRLRPGNYLVRVIAKGFTVTGSRS